jgi:hypothetical protein
MLQTIFCSVLLPLREPALGNLALAQAVLCCTYLVSFIVHDIMDDSMVRSTAAQQDCTGLRIVHVWSAELHASSTLLLILAPRALGAKGMN